MLRLNSDGCGSQRGLVDLCMLHVCQLIVSVTKVFTEKGVQLQCFRFFFQIGFAESLMSTCM